MNARFRIGNTYNFEIHNKDEAFVSTQPLTYVGFNAEIERYEFIFFGESFTGLGQGVLRKWIEKGYVTANDEWSKNGQLKTAN